MNSIHAVASISISTQLTLHFRTFPECVNSRLSQKPPVSLLRLNTVHVANLSVTHVLQELEVKLIPYAQCNRMWHIRSKA
jgi:hypothetical protein